MIKCKCIDNEQRKLLLNAIGALIVSHTTDIDIWESELEFEKFKDIAIPYFKEKIKKLEEIEQEIKEIPTCGPA